MHVFDIIGPIMIGPSSSHTAGAARIGRVARRLLNEDVLSARIGLYGSFAATAVGHGTDRALIAGLLDMDVSDVRLRNSFDIAKAQGLVYTFHTPELRDAHPNTVTLDVTGATQSLTLRAASIGGGSIRVDELNGMPVNFSGSEHTLVIPHRDQPGVIAQVSGLLAYQGVNIATMQVSRERAGGEAVMVLEVDVVPTGQVLGALTALPGINHVSLLKKL